MRAYPVARRLTAPTPMIPGAERIKPGVYLHRNGGHPWDGRPGFDWLQLDLPEKAACDAVVKAAMAKHWQPWLIGVSEDGTSFGGLLYKPCGADAAWVDTPACPHPGGTIF